MTGADIDRIFGPVSGRPLLVLSDEEEVAVVAMALASLGALATSGKAGDKYVEERCKRILSDPIFAEINARASLRASTRTKEFRP